MKERERQTPIAPARSLIATVVFIDQALGPAERQLLAGVLENKLEPGANLSHHTLGQAAKAVLGRLSWLTPIDQLDEAILSCLYRQKKVAGPFGEIIPQGELVLLGRYAGCWGGQEKSYRQLASELGTSRNQPFLLSKRSADSVVKHLARLRLPTVTGSHLASSSIEENLEIVLEQAVVKHAIPVLPHPPAGYWDQMTGLLRAVQNNPFLLDLYTSLTLNAPDDYFLAQELSRLPPRAHSYAIREVLWDWRNLQFAEIGRHRRPDLKPITQPELLPVETENPLEKPDLGSDRIGTMLYHSLYRAKVRTVEQLLARPVTKVVGIKQLGRAQQHRLLEYLSARYPQERLTQELTAYLNS